ncbi:NAD-dependent deacylase [Bdellovibrio bacteriovorus]|uniref:NAD-dependent protein deacylase n=1 Tax=Bdellovibrio bacteriovorus TaxID=959 RepID=A0A150WRG3_BDEBC|nr:NAD-dependent deacylase [Bdellovibrio bacteriovorus]KYG66805.1 NAD-dependent deacylase [Bdellovibrio bacteriovorus]
MSGNLLVLTGAGISADSGVQTFRDANGLWENHRIEEVASLEAFRSCPDLVHNFYNVRRRQLKDSNIKPNAAHLALSELEAAWPGNFHLISQNVDDLHWQAGSKKVLNMHGQLNQVLCEACNQSMFWSNDLSVTSVCKFCGHVGMLRPDIVWFGESPHFLGLIEDLVRAADIFIAVGTSGVVYPAAGFVHLASQALKIEVNLAPTEKSKYFDEVLRGSSTEVLPSLVDRLLNPVTLR